MLRLLLIVSLLGAGSSAADARPATTPQGAMQRALDCAKSGPCVAAEVFSDKALIEWTAISKMLGTKVKILSASLIRAVEPAHRARWQRKWGRAVDKLARAGFDKKRLLQLGDGRAVVRIGPSAALALVQVDMERGGRTRSERLLFSLVKKPDGWRVAFIEDSVSKHVRFLQGQKP